MANNFIEYRSRTDDGSLNRAHQTRRDDDVFKTPSITLYDIDYAILWHIKNRIQPEIEENGKLIQVPVVMADGETWAQIQRHATARHKSRKALGPIISLKRTNVATDIRVPKLDVDGNNNATTLVHFADQETNNKSDWIHKTHNTKKSKTIYLSVIPDHVIVTYDLYIWTELQSQMNIIVNQLIPQDRLPWGDTFRFSTTLRDYSFETVNVAGEDRVVRCQVPLEVSGILQSEYELKESTIRKAHTTKRVVFKNEVEQVEIYPDHKPKIIRPGKSRLSSKKL